MKIGRNKLRDVWLGTVHAVRRWRKVKSTKAMAKNSTTSDTIVLEVWIMFGLLLSVVAQTVVDNPLLKHGEKQDIED